MQISNKHVNEDLKIYENNFFNIIYSDPPYSLGSKVFVDIDGKMKYKGKAQDFMSKWSFDHEDWETFFKESFRTLKHGGFCILYGMDRQQPLIQYYAIRAGFEIQQSLYWYFISSMPKAADLSKNIDKREGAEREVVGRSNRQVAKVTKDYGYMGTKTFFETAEGRENSKYLTAPSTDLAQKYDGWKYSISPFKQVVETIMVFKKPTKNKSVLDDVYAYEKGDKTIHPCIINIDGGRVPTSDFYDIRHYDKEDCFQNLGPKKSKFQVKEKNNQGRYSSQMFLDEYCADRIDEQSFDRGIHSAGNERENNRPIGYVENGMFPMQSIGSPRFGDSGGASRINHIIPWTEEEMDLLYYEPKVSGKERNAGLDEFFKLKDGISKEMEEEILQYVNKNITNIV